MLSEDVGAGCVAFTQATLATALDTRIGMAVVISIHIQTQSVIKIALEHEF